MYCIKDAESGSGSGGLIADVLYTGSQLENTITLSHAYTDYEFIFIQFTTSLSTSGFLNSTFLKTSDINTNDYLGCTDDVYYIWYQVTSSTQFTFASNTSQYFIKSICGIKTKSGGSGSGGGIDYSTTEQDTGLKWIDGRPIYQRTYYMEQLYSGTISTLDSNFGPSIYDEYWVIDTYWKYDYYGEHMVGSIFGGTGGHLYTEADDSRGLLVVNYTGIDASDVYITIRYTKVSDIS